MHEKQAMAQGLMAAIPLVGMTAKGADGMRMQFKDLIGALIVGAISAAGSVYILTARLDERSVASVAAQAEIKTLINKVSDKQDDLSQRVARIEGGLQDKKK